MNNRRLLKFFLAPCLTLFPLTLHASFIESTIGTAVVNDATAAYYNPAALTLLKNQQIIGLGSFSYLHTQFTGQSTQSITGFTQSGSSSAQTNYFLPSLYYGIPVTDKMIFGLAIVSNVFNRNVEENSILRYVQAGNSVKNVDFVPAVGIKFNELFSLGAGINLSYANFLLEPLSGFPSLNIPDSQSRNEVDATGLGADAGILLKPLQSTLIGFNYRSAITYRLSGTSTLATNPAITSNQYAFNFWTPARSVLSINQFVTPALAFIATVQRIQWSIFKNINIHGIATQIGPRAVILNASVPYYLHNTWLLTLGTNYRLTPKWIVRVAGSYNQSPGNSSYQISTGNSYILGASVGYDLSKSITIDGSYAHAFIQNQSIHATTSLNMINGVNKGFINSFSLKLTVNV